MQGKVPFSMMIVLVLGMVVHGTVYYFYLPDQVATHYDFYGQPDAFGLKLSLVLAYVLTAVGIGIVTFSITLPMGLPCYRVYVSLHSGYSLILAQYLNLNCCKSKNTKNFSNFNRNCMKAQDKYLPDDIKLEMTAKTAMWLAYLMIPSQLFLVLIFGLTFQTNVEDP